MVDIFNKYAKQFDMNTKEIIFKYHHSFRVSDIARNIAISLNLSDEDIKLAKNCGLLHDIARFKQFTEYKTYIDANSFDHGDVGYEILKELLEDSNDKDIILMATKYHNKYELGNVDDRTKLFCNIVRDADKLDIIKEQGNFMNDEEIIIKKELIDAIYNDKICHNKDVKTNTDVILRMLSWVNDFNFDYSYQFLIDNNIIENKFNLLNLYGQREDMEKLKDFIYNKINNKLGGNYGRKSK